MVQITEALVKKLPKTDLHLHLDGSIRLETLIDLAKKQNVTLPAYSVEELKQCVFREHYDSLNEYLLGFGYITSVMQDSESLERISFELAEDNFMEGVRYFEVRFAPQLHCNEVLDIPAVLRAVNKGLKRSRDERNNNKNEDEPKYEYGIIATAMRGFSPEMSEYFRQLMKCHSFAPDHKIQAMASLELVRAAVSVRDQEDIPVVGFDIAGPENGFPAVIHEEAFQYAHRNFLGKTVHAGEDFGPESIFQAVSKLHAERIGHGFHLFREDLVTKETPKKKFVTDLIDFIATRRLVVEVCLTSNLQTLQELREKGGLQDHTFTKMLENDIAVTLCTDNRTVSSTTVTKEVMLAVEHFELNIAQLRQIFLTGFKKSFMRNFGAKKEYIDSIAKFFDKIVAEEEA